MPKLVTSKGGDKLEPLQGLKMGLCFGVVEVGVQLPRALTLSTNQSDSQRHRYRYRYSCSREL